MIMEGNVVSEFVRLLSLIIDYWVLSCFSPQSLRRQRGYIVTQLPLEDTVSDFWRMVDDWGVKVIVRFMDAPKEQVILMKCGFTTFGFLQEFLANTVEHFDICSLRFWPVCIEFLTCILVPPCLLSFLTCVQFFTWATVLDMKMGLSESVVGSLKSECSTILRC